MPKNVPTTQTRVAPRFIAARWECGNDAGVCIAPQNDLFSASGMKSDPMTPAELRQLAEHLLISARQIEERS